MIAAISLIRRRSDISMEQFRRHWLHPHGTMTAELPATRRYVQHHPLLDESGTNAYARALRVDGIPELWFDDIEARTIAYTSPRIAECNVDSEHFIGAVTRLVTEPHIVVETPERKDVVRLLLLATGASNADWSGRLEGRLAARSGVIGYIGHRLVEQAAAPNSKIPEMRLPIVGIAEVVFADEAMMGAALPLIIGEQDAIATAVFRIEDHCFV